MTERLAHYRIGQKLGEGGMGVVYAAHDERLDRPVAVKVVKRGALGDAHNRFWREARIAAGISHPNVCQIYDVAEQEGELFIIMELLEGESLAARMHRGSCAPAEAIQVTLGILAAVQALHARSLLHRDIKPGNVFLTAHGVKLLDFGLARPLAAAAGAPETTVTAVTDPGMVVGTPRYMSPEQIQGQTLDARSDLFAVGAILYEMIAGRPAFSGPSAVQVFHAIVYDQPAALLGPDPVPALDLAIRRALAKSPAGRYPSADEMAGDLRRVLSRCDSSTTVRASPARRLIVLPFRMLRPDPNIDFLGFSLADAITVSLSGLQSLLVRSTMTAAKYANEADLKNVARETEVDLVLTGSLLSAGDQIRISTQLVDAATGTLCWSQTSQGSLRDIFELQDQVVQRVAGSLSLSLSGRDAENLHRDVPASPAAYEYYLRANQLSYDYNHLTVARDLYLRSVEEDPNYAPAWARLGRCCRVIGKFGQDTGSFHRAEAAFRRALEINPELPLAHNLVAQLESDLGRAQEVMMRLLERARHHGSDPELFAGLTHVCRFCGLLDASLAAHEYARRLDPQVQTSITNTYIARFELEHALETSRGVHLYVAPLALIMLGRREEAARHCREFDASKSPHAPVRCIFASIFALAEGRHADALKATREAIAGISHGPEELYYFARHLAYLGEPAEAVPVLARAVDQGFFCYPAFAADPWLDSLRGMPEFRAVLKTARERHLEAAGAFAQAGGARLLGMEQATPAPLRSR
ncbi:MAG: protein kinase [Bryobacteraceae bacterium]